MREPSQHERVFHMIFIREGSMAFNLSGCFRQVENLAASSLQAMLRNKIVSYLKKNLS